VSFSEPEVRDLEALHRSFEGLAAYATESLTLTGDGPPERLLALRTSAALPGTLGIAVARGRPFTLEEDRDGGPKAVMLSYPLWQRRFGGDPAVLGRSLSLGGAAHIVVGILPAGLRFPMDEGPSPDVWVPVAFRPEERDRGRHGFMLLARLRPDVSLAQARADLASAKAGIVDRAAGFYPTDLEWSVEAHGLAEEGTRSVRLPLLLLQGAALLVLLIACANVGNLVLARHAARRHETALLQAVGASRGDLLRRVFAESLVLAAAGGVAGFLVARIVAAGLQRVSAESAVPLGLGRFDGVPFLAHASLALLSTVLVAVAPALRSDSRDLYQALHEGSRQSGLSPRAVKLRGALVVTESALSFILLVGAGLLIRSVRALAAVDPGFRPEGVVTMRLSAPPARYPDMERVHAFFAQVLEGMRAVPGVRAAGAASALPLAGRMPTTSFHLEGRAPGGASGDLHARFGYVMPGYFETMGIRVSSGRAIDARDAGTAPPVVVVDEAFARKYWPAEPPLGKGLAFVSEGAPVWREVVGVTASLKISALDRDAEPAFYLPVAQRPFPMDEPFDLHLVVRTDEPVSALRTPLAAALQDVDPELPLDDVRPLAQLLARAIAVRRVVLTLLGAFAAVALALAAVGIYGAVAQVTQERRREMGLRSALGAGRLSIAWLVVRQGLGLTTAGLGLGLLGALALSRTLRSLLYQVEPVDLATLVATALVLTVVGVVACLAPALRAAAVDPAVVLREG
jgi:predicted permease